MQVVKDDLLCNTLHLNMYTQWKSWYNTQVDHPLTSQCTKSQQAGKLDGQCLCTTIAGVTANEPNEPLTYKRCAQQAILLHQNLVARVTCQIKAILVSKPYMHGEQPVLKVTSCISLRMTLRSLSMAWFSRLEFCRMSDKMSTALGTSFLRTFA